MSNDQEKTALETFSRGEMTALELRLRLGGATYGDILRRLSEAGLPLPRNPVAGREEQIKRARDWMFPRPAPHDLKIFVVDTGPLITLAVAQSLDYLLLVNADIIIPDAVLHEATRDAARLGAEDIIDWMKAHRAHIEIAPTRAYEIFDAARATSPGLRQPDLGERAAVEVIEEPDRLLGSERGVLLCEETAVLRRVVVRDATRIVELSTLDFLRILEAEGRIQSAEQVFELAAKAGRFPSRTEKLSWHDEATRAAIQGLVKRPFGRSAGG